MIKRSPAGLKILGCSFTIILSILLSSCTYGPAESRLFIINTDIKEGTRVFVVAIRYIKHRPPTGLSTFPDGGVAKVLEQAALFYLCDANTRSVRLLAKINTPHHLGESFEPWLNGWEGDHFYFSFSGCPYYSECYGSLIKHEEYVMNLKGEFHRVGRVPASVKRFSAPLAAIPNEKNYIRISKDSSNIKVRVIDGAEFEPYFVIDNDKLALKAVK